MKKGILAALAVILILTMPTSAFAGSVRITRINYDPPGSDTGSNWSLNHEYVVIHNFGATGKWLTGWTLRDAAGHIYRFRPYRLAARHSVVIHTGHGTNGPLNRYWNSSAYIWNNTGDTATLRGRHGGFVDSCHYYGGPPGYKLC